MELPLKPVRPAIFSTPVKHLTREEIYQIPVLLRDHENAVNAYHKAMLEYRKLKSDENGCKDTKARGFIEESGLDVGSGSLVETGPVDQLSLEFHHDTGVTGCS